MALFVFVPTMRVEFVISIKSGPTESTIRMTPESTLIHRPWIIVTEPLMFPEFLHGEQIVLVGEDLFIPGAQITHDLVMDALNMPMKIRPSPARNVACRVWTVMSQQYQGIIMDLLLLILDTEDVIRIVEVGFNIVFIALVPIVGENDVLGF
jgi:hypothetical protein